MRGFIALCCALVVGCGEAPRAEVVRPTNEAVRVADAPTASSSPSSAPSAASAEPWTLPSRGKPVAPLPPMAGVWAPRKCSIVVTGPLTGMQTPLYHSMAMGPRRGVAVLPADEGPRGSAPRARHVVVSLDDKGKVVGRETHTVFPKPMHVVGIAALNDGFVVVGQTSLFVPLETAARLLDANGKPRGEAVTIPELNHRGLEVSIAFGDAIELFGYGFGNEVFNKDGAVENVWMELERVDETLRVKKVATVEVDRGRLDITSERRPRFVAEEGPATLTADAKVWVEGRRVRELDGCAVGGRARWVDGALVAHCEEGPLSWRPGGAPQKLSSRPKGRIELRGMETAKLTEHPPPASFSLAIPTPDDAIVVDKVYTGAAWLLVLAKEPTATRFPMDLARIDCDVPPPGP